MDGLLHARFLVPQALYWHVKKPILNPVTCTRRQFSLASKGIEGRGNGTILRYNMQKQLLETLSITYIPQSYGSSLRSKATKLILRGSLRKNLN